MQQFILFEVEFIGLMRATIELLSWRATWMGTIMWRFMKVISEVFGEYQRTRYTVLVLN